MDRCRLTLEHDARGRRERDRSTKARGAAARPCLFVACLVVV